MKYRKIVNKLYKWVQGEIYNEELIDYFYKWAEENNFKLKKRIRFLENMAYNSEGDIVTVVLEDEDNIYYNDSCHRYCYQKKKDEGKLFEYVR